MDTFGVAFHELLFNVQIVYSRFPQKPAEYGEKAQAQPGMERETWEGDKRLVPELSIFGWLRFHSTKVGFLGPDAHEGEFEIHYLKRGYLNWWVEETSYEFLPGSIFVVKPGQLHGGDEASLQPCEHLWFRISLDKQPLPWLPEAESNELRNGFHAIQHTTFAVSSDVSSYFDTLLQEHRSQREFGCLVARSTLHLILTTILRDYAVFAQRSRSTSLVTWRIRKALELLDQDENSSPKISELAAEVGLSESGFRERFKAETGSSPLEYMQHRRIMEARRRLEQTDHDITRIAMDLGFSSSQYFATFFRRLVGISPGEYRKSHDKRLVQHPIPGPPVRANSVKSGV